MNYLEMLDIVDVLYPVADLFPEHKSRRNVICPFHDERTPSAHLYDDHLYCFTCGKPYRAAKIAKALGVDPRELYNELLTSYGGEEELLEEYELQRDSLPDIEVRVKPIFMNENISEFAKKFFENES